MGRVLKIMFTARLLEIAVLSATAMAAIEGSGGPEGLIEPIDQDTLFPEFSLTFSDSGEYDNLTWEAHRVVSGDGYEKILLHITGDADQPDLTFDKGPVLV